VKESVTISAMLGGLFFFKFMVVEDMTMVIARSWYYGKHKLIVAKWHPTLDPMKELNMMALVWIRLPSLLLEFWDERVLGSIGNSFGHFL